MGEGVPAGDHETSRAHSHLPPPPPPPSAPPPPPPSPGTGRADRMVIVALLLAAGGWLIWIYALGAELDTGYPDGLACTGNDPETEAYASCMRASERGGAIATALALGSAVVGLTLMVRYRRARGAGSLASTVAPATWLMSSLVGLAASGMWMAGVLGGLYEDRIGPTTWVVAMAVAVAAALLVGRLLPVRIDDGQRVEPAPEVPPGRGQLPAWLLALLVSAGAVVVGGGMLLFMAGDSIFGSDQGSIDSCNREILGGCDLPDSLRPTTGAPSPDRSPPSRGAPGGKVVILSRRRAVGIGSGGSSHSRCTPRPHSPATRTGGRRSAPAPCHW